MLFAQTEHCWRLASYTYLVFWSNSFGQMVRIECDRRPALRFRRILLTLRESEKQVHGCMIYVINTYGVDFCKCVSLLALYIENCSPNIACYRFEFSLSLNERVSETRICTCVQSALRLATSDQYRHRVHTFPSMCRLRVSTTAEEIAMRSRWYLTEPQPRSCISSCCSLQSRMQIGIACVV